MKNNFEKLFKTTKPVIAMVHLPALPGSPLYNPKLGLNYILETPSGWNNDHNFMYVYAYVDSAISSSVSSTLSSDSPDKIALSRLAPNGRELK